MRGNATQFFFVNSSPWQQLIRKGLSAHFLVWKKLSEFMPLLPSPAMGQSWLSSLICSGFGSACRCFPALHKLLSRLVFADTA